MVVRRATIAELPKLLAVHDVAHRASSHPAWLRRALAERSAWVLGRKRCIVAYGVLRRSFFDRWFIESLYVAVDQRRTGCASRLLAFFETKAAATGEIWTSTNRSNRRMRKFLKKHGFVQRGRVTGLDRDDAELIFVKRRSPTK